MEIRELSFQYGKKDVLQSVSAHIQRRKITTIIGPNGCGKSTLLNLMTKNLRPLNGSVFLEDKNIQKIGLKDFARKVAIVHQYNNAPKDITVRNLVSYGRTPYITFYRKKTREDEEIIDWAMNITNVYQFKDKAISTLSGGQRQRAWIAMALAQKTEILFLDEPTTHLDIRYQLQIMNLIKNLNKDFNMTIVMVLHDISQAIFYSDMIIGLKDGKVVINGEPKKVINKSTLNKIFNVDLKIMEENSMKYVLTVSDNI
jgi:iron complex transport system ATP-binding protein